MPAAIISVGYATSNDGINWTKYDDPNTTAPPYEFSDPVLPHGGAGEFDEGKAWTPSVLPTASGYELWYAGDPGGLSHKIGYATSSDGIHWTKDPGNPVFEMSEPWTNNIISPNVMWDGAQYRMWFSGFQPQFPFAGRIGYATSAITGINDDGVATVARSPILHQNYPNPFNPSTTIVFSLPYNSPTGQARITLQIFDITGRKVRTLIDSDLPAGNHVVQWDGTNDAGQPVSSGLYFYRLNAGKFQQTRKMLLLR
ncbi:MAG: T9SS C-terminal target domain-containing protein [Chloroflexi bacterium]|nr:MAG: T9SS C-terminal target domain-containing protein [Chloroflexota bacterium]